MSLTRLATRKRQVLCRHQIISRRSETQSSSQPIFWSDMNGIPARFPQPDHGEPISHFLIDADFLPTSITMTNAVTASSECPGRVDCGHQPQIYIHGHPKFSARLSGNIQNRRRHPAHSTSRPLQLYHWWAMATATRWAWVAMFGCPTISARAGPQAGTSTAPIFIWSLMVDMILSTRTWPRKRFPPSPKCSPTKSAITSA